MQPSIILIHPSRLFSEGVQRICEDGSFKLAHIVPSFDCLSLDEIGSAPTFLVGGKTPEQTIESIRAIKRAHPASPIIAVGDALDAAAALDAGANCYLRDTANAELLLKTLDLFTREEVVLRGPPAREAAARKESAPAEAGDRSPVASSAVPRPRANLTLLEGGVRLSTPAARAQESSVASGLSEREAVILQGLVLGQANKVIANRLNITEATVKVHVKAILRKIRAKNRTQAAVWAIRNMPQITGATARRAQLTVSPETP